MEVWTNNEEIQRFRKYLQIPTVHPDVNYEPCIEFLTVQAKELDLSVKVYRISSEKHPCLIMTWIGSEPALPSILLNSHMDVVPVYEDRWTHPPFAAEIDSEGRIFARGAQDMKCVGTQYIGAIKALKAKKIQCRRTIHISFVPDEEISGIHGMTGFVKSEEFRQLKVGFCLDEGMPSLTNSYMMFYGERAIWQIAFKIRGTSGHGSLLQSNTPGEKLRYILDKLMDMRDAEVKRLQTNPQLALGDVTSVNLTIMRGGVQVNVVPSEMELCFDMRLSNDLNQREFLEQIQLWCKEAGGDIDLEFLQKTPYVETTKTDSNNPYWVAFKLAVDDLALDVSKTIFPGGTDGNLLREVGIPTFGFSPINQTPILAHDHDEYLQCDVYLRGIEIYEKIIEKVGNS